jgi:hypothetical protein
MDKKLERTPLGKIVERMLADKRDTESRLEAHWQRSERQYEFVKVPRSSATVNLLFTDPLTPTSVRIAAQKAINRGKHEGDFKEDYRHVGQWICVR